MNVLRVFVVSLFAGVSLSAQTPKPTFEIWGEHFGDLQPAKAAKGTFCDKAETMPGTTFCGDTDTRIVAGVSVTSVLRLYFDAKLSSLTLYFPSDGYGKLSEAFASKYGVPDSTYTTPLQNSMGAHFINEAQRWKFSDGFLEIRRYGDKLSEGLAIATTDEFLKAGEARRKAAAAEAATRDLGPPVKK